MTIKSTMTKKTLEDIERLTGTMLSIGKLIWAIRKADEETQVDFAAKLNISKQHLCDIERGRKSVSPRLAVKYARILGYSETQFIRLALQDLVDREGLNVQIEVSQKSTKKHHNSMAA